MFFTNRNVFLFLFLFLYAPLHAQYNFTGIIKQKEINNPLQKISVTWNNGTGYTLSGEDGSFSMQSRDSLLIIKISALGYKPAEMQLKAGMEYIIELESDHVKLEAVQLYAASQPAKAIMQWDLSLRPVRSSQELLKIVPGLFIAQHQGGGKAEQIFLRGFDIDHGTDINISVDGVPANMVSHAHGQGYADIHYLIPELVKEIDYGMGPYNTAFGNQATAGYVSFSTLDQVKKNIVKVEGGQFNSFRAMTMFNLLSKNKTEKSWYAAGEYIYSDGPFVSPQKFSRTNVFTKFTTPFAGNSLLNLQASAFYSKWNASGQVPDRLVNAGIISRFGSVDDNEGGQTSRANINAIINTRLHNTLEMVNQFYITRYDFDLFSNFTFFLNDSINGDQIQQKEKRMLYGYTGKLEKTAYRQNGTSKTSISAGFRTDIVDDSRLSHTKNRSEILDEIKRGDIKETNGFLYASHNYRFKKWFLQAGTRFDVFNFMYADKLNDSRNNTVKSIISPKMQVQYTASPVVQLYFKTGKGFHSNDTRVVSEHEKDILPAVYATDLGIILKPVKNLYLDIAAWRMNSKQEFVYVGDEGVVEASGSTMRTGIDLAMRYQPYTWLSADVNANFSHPVFKDVPKAEAYVPLAPRLCSSGGISFSPTSPVSGSLRYRHLSNRPANETNTVIAKGYTVVDMNINYRYKKFEWGAAVENILNSKWNEAQFNTVSRLQNETNAVEEIHFTPGNPVNIRFKMSYFF